MFKWPNKAQPKPKETFASKALAVLRDPTPMPYEPSAISETVRRWRATYIDRLMSETVKLMRNENAEYAVITLSYLEVYFWAFLSCHSQAFSEFDDAKRNFLLTEACRLAPRAVQQELLGSENLGVADKIAHVLIPAHAFGCDAVGKQRVKFGESLEGGESGAAIDEDAVREHFADSVSAYIAATGAGYGDQFQELFFPSATGKLDALFFKIAFHLTRDLMWTIQKIEHIDRGEEFLSLIPNERVGKPEVFISYARADKEAVTKIVERLRQLHLTVWFDEELRPGDAWEERILKRVQNAGAVVVCWSPAAVESEWVCREASEAMEKNSIVPVKIASCSVPERFQSIHFADLRDWEGGFRHKAFLDVATRVSELAQRYPLIDFVGYFRTAPGVELRVEQLISWQSGYSTDKLAKSLGRYLTHNSPPPGAPFAFDDFLKFAGNDKKKPIGGVLGSFVDGTEDDPDVDIYNPLTGERDI